ncbi:endo alpha-1,4 polygalactosaminidase [Streptomyces sp. NPDC050617]|uniref:endo alpha-1,4 polygalactosaminidase n=1 Tax=Streptomyces sp. NPDC050617 TaxID=3154628 RepID=UPI0034424E70
MSLNRVVRRSMTVAAAFSAAAATCLIAPSTASAAQAGITLPTPHVNFDYQIGGAYTPPSGVKAVSRDYTADPAPGLYNICYVNAFQTQPKKEGDWDSDLLLKDGNGDVVYDGKWGEAILDIRTEAKRKRIAAKVNGWIDTCAAKGFQAVEPDNYDTYDRYKKFLNKDQAEDLMTRLSQHAHAKGLAAGQKNSPDLAADHKATGADFAVAEECGRYNECEKYTKAFGSRVFVIEYTDKGMSKACSAWGDQLSIVQRDEDVTPKGNSEYVRKTC